VNGDLSKNRIDETFVKQSPPTKKQIEKARKKAKQILVKLIKNNKG
jgi:hypothetical protein